MSQPLVDFVIYIGNVPGHHHWTQLKDRLREMTNMPGRNVGYVHPLLYTTGGSGVQGHSMAALVRVSRKEVANQIYDVLNEQGFNHHPVKLILFECAGNDEPRMVEANFSLVFQIDQQAAEFSPGTLHPQSEWQYVLHAVSSRFTVTPEAAGLHNLLDSTIPILHRTGTSEPTDGAQAPQGMYIGSENSAAGADFTDRSIPRAAATAPDSTNDLQTVAALSIAAPHNEPLIVDGSVSDETTKPV